MNDEAEIRGIIFKMCDAWNSGNPDAFIAPFADDADFIVFEGTHLHGRQEMQAFHHHIFETAVKGTKIDAEVKFVRIVNPNLATMHSIVRIVLVGDSQSRASRDSMQHFALVKRDGRWVVQSMLNARRVPLERQGFWDDFEALTPAGREQVESLAASLKPGA